MAAFGVDSCNLFEAFPSQTRTTMNAAKSPDGELQQHPLYAQNSDGQWQPSMRVVTVATVAMAKPPYNKEAI